MLMVLLEDGHHDTLGLAECIQYQVLKDSVLATYPSSKIGGNEGGEVYLFQVLNMISMAVNSSNLFFLLRMVETASEATHTHGAFHDRLGDALT